MDNLLTMAIVIPIVWVLKSFAYWGIFRFRNSSATVLNCLIFMFRYESPNCSQINGPMRGREPQVSTILSIAKILDPICQQTLPKLLTEGLPM
jgi:hypothetical protein